MNLNFVGTARALRRRSTSVPADEFLAVASLLQIPVEHLTSKEGLDRCCEFWILLKDVPHSIIIQIQEKIPIDGFRWAPRSLIGPKATSTMYTDGGAVVTAEHGLRGTYDLLVIQKPQHFDFTKHSMYLLVIVPRRQVFRLTALSWDRPRIWCDTVIVEELGLENFWAGQQYSAAVCLSRKKEVPGLDAPQYEYKLRCGIIYGLDEREEPVDWDSTPGSKSWERLREMMNTNFLCDVSEGQTIYIT